MKIFKLFLLILISLTFSNQVFSEDKILESLEDNKKHELIKRHLKKSGFKNFSFYNLHYWKYAFTESQNNIANYFNEDNMLALCGDSFSVGQADGAVVSAQRTFEQIRNIF